MVPVTITVATTDACDDRPAIRLVSITSNEGTNANGSGNTSPDVQGAAFGTDDRQFELRAERRGPVTGRVYTITYEAEDKSGNADDEHRRREGAEEPGKPLAGSREAVASEARRRRVRRRE